MVGDSFQPQRRSIRLRGYNYAKHGAYFVTVCTYGRERLLGSIRNSAAVRSDFGRIVHRCWDVIPNRFPGVTTDSFIVMPDHIHGIVLVNLSPPKGEACLAPTSGAAVASGSALGSIVGAFKSASARQINLLRETPGAPVWQRNYHERIIRDESELRSIQDYILTNPLRWELAGK